MSKRGYDYNYDYNYNYVVRAGIKLGIQRSAVWVTCGVFTSKGQADTFVSKINETGLRQSVSHRTFDVIDTIVEKLAINSFSIIQWDRCEVDGDMVTQ